MDNSDLPVEAAEAVPPERNDHGGEEGERAPVPLRLTLQPSGLIVEVTTSETVVGRHSEANLRLPLPDVSRRHCRLFFTHDGWHVHDLDSLNGVYVNEVRVRKAVLHHHDALRIGSFTFRVDLRSTEPTLREPGDEGEQMIRGIVDILASPPPSRKAS